MRPTGIEVFLTILMLVSLGMNFAQQHNAKKKDELFERAMATAGAAMSGWDECLFEEM